MERRFTAALAGCFACVGVPVWLTAQDTDGPYRAIGIGFIALAGVCLFIWAIATGVLIGVRESRDRDG